jgi:hypothetical protein
VGHPVGAVRRQAGVVPGQKAYEDSKEQSHDEAAGNSPPKFGFDRRFNPRALGDLLLQFAINLLHGVRPGSEMIFGVKSQESNCLKNSMIPVFALFQSYRQDRYVASEEAGYLWSGGTPET